MNEGHRGPKPTQTKKIQKTVVVNLDLQLAVNLVFDNFIQTHIFLPMKFAVLQISQSTTFFEK